MRTETLYISDTPYLLVAQTSPSEITNFGWSLRNHDSLCVAVRFLRGKKMTTTASLFDEFAAALQFPYYFGENWDAFDECITDLSWLPADVYVLIITDAKDTLSKEDQEQFSLLIEILQEAANEWSCPIETSDQLKRPTVPFHVIFQCTDSERMEFVSRLQSTGAPYEESNIETPSIR